MTDAPCPACGATTDFGAVCDAGACPECDTPLSELHAVAIEDGGSE